MIENDTDQLLKYKYIFPEKYASEHIEEVKNELLKRGIDVSNFDDSTYIDCVILDFPSGWNLVLQEMFSALITSGWKSDNKLHYNFSFGSITIEGLRDTSSAQWNEIVERFIIKLHQTCCRCSSHDTVEHFEDEYLCRSCMLIFFSRRKVKDLSEKGFAFYNSPIYSNEEGFFEFVQWEEIKQVSLSQVHDLVKLELCKLSPEEQAVNDDQSYLFFWENYIQFNSDSTINFFELLRNLLENFSSDSTKEEIENILKSLKFCKICEKKAIIINQCKICKNFHSSIETPDKRYIEKLGSVEKFIEYKKEQFLQFKNDYFSVRYLYENDLSFDILK